MVCTKVLLCYGLHRCEGYSEVPWVAGTTRAFCSLWVASTATSVFTRYGLLVLLRELLLLQTLQQEFLLSWFAGTTARVATLADTTTGVSTLLVCWYYCESCYSCKYYCTSFCWLWVAGIITSVSAGYGLQVLLQ